MTRRVNHTLRLLCGLCGLATLAWAGVAPAQSTAPTTSTAPASSAPAGPAASWSAANLPATPVYQDHFIGGGTLVPDISAGDGGFDDNGLARSLQIDGVVSALTSHSGGAPSTVTEDGIILKSQWETAGYGAWSLDAAARTGASGAGTSEEGQGGVVTLRQRGMPFDGGWVADNALGDINSPDINLARLQQRFYLPTGSIQGLTTEWRGPDGLQMVAGGGVPGLYDGIEVPDFRTLGGSTATAGAQWSPAAHWTVGGQFIEAHDVNLAAGPLIDGTSLVSSSTGLVSAAWADQGERLQMNLIDGAETGKSNSLGGWIDGTLTQGRVLQNAGLFRVEPNVSWGNQLISSDMQGGYYRLNYQTRQWLADVGIDEVRSVSGLGSNTTFLTGDTRYQVARDWGVGGVANVSHSDGGTGWSLEGYFDHLNDWGSARAQADYATNPSGRDSTFTVDQTWNTPVGMQLSTSAFVERISGAVLEGLAQDSTALGLAAYGGGKFGERLGIEGNVRWETIVQGRAAPAVSANVSLTYRMSPHWQMLATYYDSRAASWTPLTVESPLTPPALTTIPAVQERGVFLTFRYQRAAGLHFAPLGGAPGAGAGDIAGIVYLDANTNGHLDAGEVGAANVTVVLDGRFSVQTDAAGRFSFPVVTTGHHLITVISDNLPLPWTLVNEGRTEVQVNTRDRTEIAIAAQRPR
jgi:hypothetical protein